MHKKHFLATVLSLAAPFGTIFASEKQLSSLLKIVKHYNKAWDAYEKAIRLRKELNLHPVRCSRTSKTFTYYVYHSKNKHLTTRSFYREDLEEMADLFETIFEQEKFKRTLLEKTQKEYGHFRYSPLAHWYFVGDGSNEQSEKIRSYEEKFLTLGKNNE